MWRFRSYFLCKCGSLRLDVPRARHFARIALMTWIESGSVGSCWLASFIGPAHCPFLLVLFIGLIYWFCSLVYFIVLFIDFLYWSCSLASSTGPVHRPVLLVLFLELHHSFCSLGSSIDPNHWPLYCSFSFIVFNVPVNRFLYCSFSLVDTTCPVHWLFDWVTYGQVVFVRGIF